MTDISSKKVLQHQGEKYRRKFHILEKLSLQKGKEKGFDTDNMIMCGRVATLLDNGQNSIPQLSKTLGISRQATHKAVGKLVKKGFVQMQEWD
ncbi:MAG: winged helix-turn-helix domain-containing protein [Epsilonproteobacteria bacterium]|nr:winged helix-turn-helix domain-containing protein [Campylobacterota bacterium]